MLSEFIIAAVAITLALFYWTRFRKSKYSFPKGPRGLPLLGNVAQIKDNPHLKFFKWAEEFGDIYTIYLGLQPTIVVNDTPLIKELFSTPASTGRFKTDTILLISGGPYGVANTEGADWQEQRSFCSRNLAKYGFSKMSSLEPIFIAGVQQVIDWVIFKTESHSAVSPIEVLEICSTNTITAIVTGEEIDIKDSKMATFVEKFMLALQRTQQTGLGFLPWLKYIAPEASGFNEFNKLSAEHFNMSMGLLEDRRKTHIPGSPRDLVDSYVDHLKTVKDPKSSFFGEIGEKNAAASIGELFMAAAETTSQTLSWLILYLCHHPEVQSKLHSEIDRVVGNSRDPSLLDKANLPYTEAVILETLRISSIVPFGLIHELMEDLKFQSYSLPKGTLLIANVYYTHHSTKFWNEPSKFQPERFLDPTETTVINREKILPFLAGRRACLGESLSKNLMFLFTAKFFQALKVLPDPSQPEADFKPVVGLLLRVPAYKAVFSPRT